MSFAAGMQASIILSHCPCFEIRRVVTGRALECIAGFTLALVCVAAAGLLVVVQWEAWMREDQQLTKRLIKSWLRQVYIRSVGSCPRVLRVSFSCFPGFSLVLHDHWQRHTTLWKIFFSKCAIDCKLKAIRLMLSTASLLTSAWELLSVYCKMTSAFNHRVWSTYA